jgi:hypothetical protein
MNQGQPNMSHLPKYSQNQRKGNVGVRIVDGIISDSVNWLFRELPKDDFSIDAHIEVVQDDGGVTGKLIAAQIKCGTSFSFCDRVRTAS